MVSGRLGGRALSLAALSALAMGERTARAEDPSPTATTTTVTTTTTTTTTTATGPAPVDPFVPYPPPSPRVLSPPDISYDYAEPQPYPTLLWFATQLVPSPEVAFGRIKRTQIDNTTTESVETAFGLRWQLTPALWSWGTHRRLSRWRFFVVDPLARNAGSIELDAKLEYLWGHVERMLVRPGIRGTFPLLQRGEYLSFALGTSTYTYDGTPRVAYDAGVYSLFGLIGAEITVAPAHNPLTAIATLRLRYF